MRTRRQLGGGYAHPGYARALAEFGRPRALAASGGWVLEREIPGAGVPDAMGCYPLFACHHWAGLRDDLASLAGPLVSLTLVSDPFGDYTEKFLHETFPDLVSPFKQHFVARLDQPGADFVSSHHRYYAQRALARVQVEHCPDPPSLLREWCALYANLARRHGITGIQAFSEDSFARQLALPGAIAFRATCEGETVGAHLWLVDGEVAYSHLAATSDSGYELMAAYALHWQALDFFAERVRYLDWGGGAGLRVEGEDGLARFKRGWANETRMAFLCGRILDPQEYRRICATRERSATTSYFPAYRAGEFH